MSIEGPCAYVACVEGHFVLAIDDSGMISFDGQCLGDEKTAQTAVQVFATQRAIAYSTTLVQPDQPIMTMRAFRQLDPQGLLEMEVWYPTIICSTHQHVYINWDNFEGKQDTALATSQMLAGRFGWDFMPEFQIACGTETGHDRVDNTRNCLHQQGDQQGEACDILDQIEAAMLADQGDLFTGIEYEA